MSTFPMLSPGDPPTREGTEGLRAGNRIGRADGVIEGGGVKGRRRRYTQYTRVRRCQRGNIRVVVTGIQVRHGTGREDQGRVCVG